MHLPKYPSLYKWFIYSLVFSSVYINVINLANASDVATNKQLINLQLKWLHQFQFAGYYAAQQQGFYKQNGLEVNILEGGLNKLAIQEVHSGAALYGVAGAEILLDHIKTHQTMVLAAIFQHSPYVLISLKQANINHPADLVGKRVMLSLPYTSRSSLSGEQGLNEFKLMLWNEGIDINQVILVNKTWDLNDLTSLKVDAIMGYLPVQPNILKSNGYEVNLIKSINYSSDYYGDTLFTTTKEAEEHPERVQAFLKATQAG